MSLILLVKWRLPKIWQYPVIGCEFITKDMGTKTLPVTYQPELNLCMNLVIMETWQELLQRKPKPLKSRFTTQSVKRLDL